MMFSDKDLAKIIIPLLIEQILSITIGMIDTMMVANVGENAVSAVSLVDSVNLFLVYLFSALATGGAVVTTQYLGAKKKAEANKSAKQLVYVVFAVATVITVLATAFHKSILGLIFGSISPAIMKNAEIYFVTVAVSFPFLGLYNSGAAIFRAMGNSKISMLVSLFMNIVNVVGNAVLIFVFDMGVFGAAAATTFSRIAGGIIIIALAHNRNNEVYLEKLHKFKPDFSTIKRILGIGIPNGLENGMFQFGKIITQSVVSSLGTVAIAANAVANSVSSLQYVSGNAVSHATIPIVGKCVGAGERAQAKKYSRKLLLIAYACIITVAVIMTVFLKPVIGIYNLSEKASSLAYKLMLCHALCVSTVWPIAFTLPNSFRAASDVKFTMIVSIFSMWLFRVGFCYLLVYVFKMGIMGVWTAMFIDWLCRASFFGARYMSGKWLEKYNVQ